MHAFNTKPGHKTDMVLTTIFVVLAALFLQWLVSEKLVRRSRRLPPGPTALPIVGNLHNLSTKPHKALAQLAKTHGPLMYLRLGFSETVVVSSSEMARQVMQKKDAVMSNRAMPDCFSRIKLDHYFMAFMPVTQRWRSERKYAATLLFSNKALDTNQELRTQKIKDLISYVKTCSEAKVAVNIGQVVFDTSLNLLSNTLFSKNLADPGSELSRQFKQLPWDISKEGAKPNLADFYPVFKGLDLQGIKRRMASHFDKLLDLLDVIVAERLDSYKDGLIDVDQCSDVLDALLKINKDESQEFEHSRIRYMLAELLLGGTETTSSTLEWAMAEILHDPMKLKATQEELNRVIGRGNLVKEEDFDRLPYLQAVLNETFRLHPPLPLLLPRKASADVEIHGFKVPNECRVIVNAWAIGRDPDVWRNPNGFEPERFMDSEISYKGSHFELLPFGSGRRVCPGLPLVVRILPLMLGNLVNWFDWKLEDGAKYEDMDMEEKSGISARKATPFYAIPIDMVV